MKRIKPPQRLRVLGKVGKCFLVPAGDRKLRDSDDDDEPGRGRYQENSLTFYVEEEQVLDQEQDTVLHELWHLIDDLLEIDLSEEQVVKLTTAWLAVLKENPKLISYLKRREPDAGSEK